MPGRGQFARQLAATVGGNRCGRIAFHARLVAGARPRRGQRGNHDQHRPLGAVRTGSRDGFDAARVHACEIGRPHRLHQARQVEHHAGLRLRQRPFNAGAIGRIAHDELGA